VGGFQAAELLSSGLFAQVWQRRTLSQGVPGLPPAEREQRDANDVLRTQLCFWNMKAPQVFIFYCFHLGTLGQFMTKGVTGIISYLAS
jgi:hypothetical protein